MPRSPALSSEDVVRIREARAAGVGLRVLAEEHAVSASTISTVAQGKAYPEAGGPITPRREPVEESVAALEGR